VKVQLLVPFGRGLNIETPLVSDLIEALVGQFGRHHFHFPMFLKQRSGLSPRLAEESILRALWKIDRRKHSSHSFSEVFWYKKLIALLGRWFLVIFESTSNHIKQAT
jgi:hypothetical protein